MMVLRHILAALCEMFSVTYEYIMTDGYVEQDTTWPPRSPDFNPLEVYLRGHLKALVYAAHVDNEEALHRIVDACHTTHNYSGVCELMWLSRRALNIMDDVKEVKFSLCLIN
jgi:hypothetical protein